MKKNAILAIAPYEGMANILHSLAQSRPDIELTIRVGNLQEGLQIAQALVQQTDYDAVISRGGTAELLRGELDLPVIDVPLTVYDLLRSIKLAENYSGRFAITGYSTITETAKILSDILRLDLKIITFHDASEVLPALKELKSKAYSLVICDMISYSTAQSIGLNALFVSSGAESIEAAIKNATDMIQLNARCQLQNKLLRAALAGEDNSLLIFDENKVLVSSSLSRNPQNTAVTSKLMQQPDEFLQHTKTTVHQQGATINKIESRVVDVENEPYTIIKISQKPTLYARADNAVSVYNDPRELITDHASSLNSANLIGKTNIFIEKYAPTTFPILITGEIGVGKDKAAVLLYHYGMNRHHPYYVIDCKEMTDDVRDALLSSETSPFNDVGSTIYIKDIGRSTLARLENFYTFIKNTKLTTRNRLIFSIVTSDEKNQDIVDFLLNTVHCLHLPIAPLRERKEDIDSIAMLYIAQLNLELGKQILGFESDAAARIRDYSWPQNLGQFRRILTELVTLTDSAYIDLKTVNALLDKEEKLLNPHAGKSNLSPLDLSLSLDEINREIIRTVLKEEGMTKEKAAQRLGISRTTLWRMLKDY